MLCQFHILRVLGLLEYYAWNVKSCGDDAASQQTYFIVSGSPVPIQSNTREGDQNVMLVAMVSPKKQSKGPFIGSNLFNISEKRV